MRSKQYNESCTVMWIKCCNKYIFIGKNSNVSIIGGVILKAVVDKDTCIACGLCPSICPEVFEMEDDGKAGTVTDSVPEDVQDSAKEAEESCPVNAISVS